MKRNILKELKQNKVFPMLVILFGSVIVAFGLAGFLVPHRIVAGGTSGLATIVYHLTGFPIGAVAILLDIPLFLWSFYTFGFGFMTKTFLSAMFLGVFLQLFNWAIPNALAADPLLSCLYGGLITGVGMGIIFRFGATTGGTDLIASIFRHYFGWKLGTGLFIADGIIIGLSGILFSPDLVLYGILTVFITTRVVDMIQSGPALGKSVFIISAKSEEIKEAIYKEVQRGVTIFHGKGGYLEEEQNILYVVVSPKEVGKLKDVVCQKDEDAFFVVSSAMEVMGEGFVPAIEK